MAKIFKAIIDRIFGKKVKVFRPKDVPENYGTFGRFGKRSS